MRPMMTFLRINLERRFCASKWRKFINGENLKRVFDLVSLLVFIYSSKS